MPSIGSYVAQIPKGGNVLIAYRDGGAALAEANLPTSASTGYVSNVGSSYVFSSTANAATAIKASVFTTLVGEEYVDMGKKIYIYVNSSTGGVPMLYAVLNKTRQIGLGGNGGVYEGGEARVFYLVTWSADNSDAEVRPAVIRSGSTNGAI